MAIVADPVNESSPETLKLTKNSKGYTWEIRLRCELGEKINEALLSRMENLNNEMIKRFEGMKSALDYD